MTLPSYEASIWVLTGFFTLYGLIFLWMSRSATKSQDTGFMKARLFFFLFALLYFSFAHYSAYTGIIYSTDMGITPPCENLINTTTLTGNTTAYTYYPSCNQTPPAAHNAFTIGYGWLLWIELIVLLLGSLFIMIWRMYKKW